jgi:hypothetical protein
VRKKEARFIYSFQVNASSGSSASSLVTDDPDFFQLYLFLVYR